MIDIKYHIYSLFGIFIALAAGILIGIGLAGGPGTQKKAIQSQAQRIEDLQKDFKSYSERLTVKDAAISDLTSKMKDFDVLVQKSLPSLVANKLTGRGVSIIQIGKSGDIAGIQKSLKAAGAAVHGVVHLKSELLARPEELAKAAQKLPMSFQQSGKDPMPQLLSYLATVLSTGNQADPFSLLTETGFLTAEGDFMQPNRFIVILAPNEIQPENLIDSLITPLIAQLQANKLKTVIAVESMDRPSNNDPQPLEPYRDVDSPIVKHADYAMGQVCMIDALVDGNGVYGFGKNEKLLPDRLIAK